LHRAPGELRAALWRASHARETACIGPSADGE
jgi:hypothetical protein